MITSIQLLDRIIIYIECRAMYKAEGMSVATT